MLIEIHMLQNHGPSNLNRDDTGSPKDAVFGGYRRARISSQCLKRSIRRSEVFQDTLKGHLGFRTRRLPELVRDRLIEGGMDKPLAEAAGRKVSEFGKKEREQSSEQPKKKTGDEIKLDTAQTMFLSDRDVDAIVTVLREAATKAGTPQAMEKLSAAELQKAAELKGFRPVPVDIALFGRMTTSEALRDTEGCVQAMHAISTHKVDREFDYFTAVDDLRDAQAAEEEDAGADMIGDVEFNSACYYKYFSIDRDGLVANLTGERLGRPRADVTDSDRAEARGMAARGIEAFLRAAALSTPTGKQNSFAAHEKPALVLVEVRPTRTPTNYANAFVDPARPGKGEDLVRNSLSRFAEHVTAVTAGYNLAATGRWLLAPEHPDFAIEGVERVPDLNALCARVREAAENG